MRKVCFVVALPLVAGAIVACARPAPVEEAPPAAEVRSSQEVSAPAEVPPPVPAAEGMAGCPDSDTRPTVVIRGCDTGVANIAVGDCTLADQLHACESGSLEDFPRCIAKTTERLIEAGVIKGKDKGALQICSADDRESEGEAPTP